MNVPALGNIRLKEPCAAIDPEFQRLVSEVEVCATLSLLVHVTVAPAGTVSGFGEYAFVVRVEAPETIETVIPEPPVDGRGVGDVVGEDEPQPNDALSTRAIATKICMRMLAVKTISAPSLGADWAPYAGSIGDKSLSGSVTVPDS